MVISTEKEGEIKLCVTQLVRKKFSHTFSCFLKALEPFLYGFFDKQFYPQKCHRLPQ